ncbi:MAG: tRNA-dihydrouridine synthase [Pirellulales bacterium]|nr:tRNA-dihydrouridine synthase [Pirellulales bacterium]
MQIGPLTINPPLLSAPMAGFTNHAFRRLFHRFGGVGLPTTEMISARSFAYTGGDASERLWGIKDEPRPLAVQIWDNDPEVLAEVGRRLVEEYRVSVVDINFGCPVRDVAQKAESGSYLLDYPDRIGAIIERVAAACRPSPVTAKIRLGRTRDRINAIDVAQAVEGAGGAAVTVHGRTADQMFRGAADWEEIARVKPRLERIPLIGNGDLRTPAAVVEAFERYGVDGAMIGRAALGRPWLFAQAAAALRGEPVPPDPTLDEQRRLLLDHFAMIVEQYGPLKGTVLMRSRACRYGQGRSGACEFRRRISKAATQDAFAAIVEIAFPRG